MSRGLAAFQPERLKQALAARRLTQVQVSALVGVSPTTVSKWRTGTQAPEADTLSRLASVLNVSPEWFTRPLSAAISAPLFRSNASAHVAARAMLQARVEWAQDLALNLAEFVDYPELRIPSRSYTDPEQISPTDVEEAAAECRELWRLGRQAIPDLALAVEGAGVIVVREETGIAPIEGLSAWSAALGRPVIFLSADKANGYRSRFDLAHELGHLILHRHITRTEDRDRHKQLEKQAHYFAGAFLLPPETFALDVRAPVSLDDLLLLKRRWGVSVGAIIMRLKALRIIDADEAANLFKRRSARWGAKAEPGDGDRKPEKPRLLARTIELLVDSAVLPLEGVARHVGLSSNDVEALAGLPERYFQGTAKIVQFARLRSNDAVAGEPATGNVIPFRRSGG